VRVRGAIAVGAFLAAGLLVPVALEVAESSPGRHAAVAAAGHPAGARADAPRRARRVRSRLMLGRSVQGRPIHAAVLAGVHPTRSVLVVGCIHGNERAGIPLARMLAAGPPVHGARLWIVFDLNPDGAAADTRQNAHGVDLNRNFPFGWRPIGVPGDQQYAGPRPLSEPESRIARALVLRIRPAITIWFHQPLGVTDQSGGDARVERRFARLSGLPLRRLTRYPGSVATWQDRVLGETAFVVELPPGSPTRLQADRYVAAVRALAASRGGA
jgi:murein peptide amidase A